MHARTTNNNTLDEGIKQEKTTGAKKPQQAEAEKHEHEEEKEEEEEEQTSET